MITKRPGPGAIVIGDDYRSLGVVRSLGRKGVRVWVLRDDHNLAHWSRFCERTLPWPDGGERAKVAHLLDLAHRHALEGWMLFPTEDQTAALIARNREALGEHYRLSILADWETLQWTYDKRLTYKLAAELGLQHPRTWYPAGREEVLRFDGVFPAILKPAISGPLNSFTISKAWPARDLKTLVARYDEACAVVDPSLIMIQEVIPGSGESQFSYAALCKNGRPLASLVARRTRQWPIDFGRASTYVETVDAPEVEENARLVLAALGFSGVVEVEFKRDPRDGTYRLLDINPRVWGWHTLGRRAGVDFPWLLWNMVSGAPITPTRGRPGVRWVRALTDVPTALGEIRAGRLSVFEYAASLRGPIEYAVLSWDDPLPALVELPGTLSLAWKRRRAAARTHATKASPLASAPRSGGGAPR
jgi:predicted ATP-grasp superfamily ATP-dependent carboligase